MGPVSASWCDAFVSSTSGTAGGRRPRRPADVPRVVRAPARPVVPPVLDEAQRRAVQHRGGPVLVLAGPGTGKTTTIVEAVVQRVEAGEITPDQALVLTYSRRAAVELRERIAARLDRTIREPIARTFHSYAFGLLRADAARRGEPTPRLLSGAEQDLVVRELLRGDVEAGAARWPERLQPALGTRGFAQELRDLIQRAVERGISPRELAEIGRRRKRDDWIAAGKFAQQYEQVSSLREAASYDPAELIREAAGLLRSEPAVLQEIRAAHVFVVVDEYQDTDPAQEELLSLLVGSRDLLAVGDPDQSIYAFRGADLDSMRRFGDRFRTPDGSPPTVIALDVSRRSGVDLLRASRGVARRLTGPAAHRALRPADGIAPGSAEVHIFGTANAEAAFIAHRLREAHLVRGVAWAQMAVLVRSGNPLPALRRALMSAGVPVSAYAEEQPLVDVPIVRALLLVLEVVTDRIDLTGAQGVELALDLVSGPLGGADPLALRRLRQELRAMELAAGGGRASGALLADALQNPAELVAIDQRVARPATRVAAVLAAGRAAASNPAATAENVLWQIWNAADLASRLGTLALAGEPGSAAADRDLDAVVALFDVAARYADRLPKAGPGVFLDHLRGQQIPGDTLAPQAPNADGVRLMTAHAAKGLEWQVVVVAGVQEGVWPDLRGRGSLLGSQQLVDVLAAGDEEPAGHLQTLAARLAEERRLFYVAVTRAQHELVATAVRGDDQQPSRFLDELVPTESDERPLSRVPRGLDLAAVVAELRAVVTSPSPDPDVGGRASIRKSGAAAQLARLAAAGVRGANPADWYGLGELTDERPLVDDGEPVRVSPSRLEAFRRCPLRWMLESSGGTTSSSTSQGLGTLVHALAQQAADEGLDAEELQARLATAIERVDLGSGWFAIRQRERATEMVRKLAIWLRTNPRAFVAAELAFKVTVGRAVLKGQVDRLERDADGRLVVVDLKTGKSQPKRDELPTNAQLGAYQLAVEEGAFADLPGGGRVAGGAELVQLGTTTVKAAINEQKALSESDDPQWALHMVEESAEGMAGQIFAAVANDMCRSCPVRTSCPVHDDGRQVTA
jgi:superfamily I DNA/RNA helicase/RecB family exonuclease